MLFLFARSMKNWIKPFIGPLLIAMGILLIGLSPYIRMRFDLSEEKKFTLSASSIELIRQQDGPIRIKVWELRELLFTLMRPLKKLQKLKISAISSIRIYKR